MNIGYCRAAQAAYITIFTAFFLLISGPSLANSYNFDDRYDLRVNNGEGSGRYSAGERVYVTTYRSNFKCWRLDQGDDDVSINTVYNRSFSFNMPNTYVELTALTDEYYCQDNERDPDDEINEHYLDVTNGTGDGYYSQGDYVTIRANSMDDEEFLRWEVGSQYGSIDFMTGYDAYSQVARIRMGHRDLNITAVYKERDEEEQVYLTIDGGKGSGNYQQGQIVKIRAIGEKGEKFERWEVVGYSDVRFIGSQHSANTRIEVGYEDTEIRAVFSNRNDSDSERNFELIKLQQNENLCISAPDSPKKGDLLKLKKCDLHDRSLLWSFTHKGQWKASRVDNLCVSAKSIARHEKLILVECTPHQTLNWLFDDNGDEEITNLMTADLCVTYGQAGPRVGSKIRLGTCNHSTRQRWSFARN